MRRKRTEKMVEKKKLKDKEHIEAKITISKLRECWKVPYGQEFKDKSLLVKVEDSQFNTYQSFEDNRNGHRKLIKFLREELYLKK